MTVFLTYHTLEERDTRHISRTWKWLIIGLLCVATATSIGASYSIYALEYVFEMNCFLYASLVIPVLPEQCQPTVISRLDFFQYSVAYTSWGLRSHCDYAIFMPLFQAFTSAVCAAMFMIFGRGGASVSGLIPQPWCIVFPSTIYMIVMTILSLFYAQFIHKGLMTLCEQLTYENPKCSCFDLMNIFEGQEFGITNRTFDKSLYSIMLPSENYVLIHIYMYIAMVAYACMVFVMILRCLCVTDFKLVRVTIATYDGDIETLLKEESKLKLHRASNKKRATFVKESKAAVDIELEKIINEVVSKLVMKEQEGMVELELELDFESVNESVQTVQQKKQQ